MIPQKTPSPKPPPITLDLTEKRTVRVVLSNVLRILEQHPAWQEALGFDELLQDVVFLRCPPYLKDTGHWTVRPITEQDFRETADWLHRTYRLYATSALAGEGLTTYASRFPFHAIRNYLNSLTWDKHPRLDEWLTRYCHAADNPYTRAVASKTLVAAVARVYAPGCKVDTMTILEGKQGTTKSTVWNTLAGDQWFSDTLADLHDKDAMQGLCGTWFIEFAELAHFQRSEIETVKRFVSGKVDHYRPAYGRKVQTFPRQNIFVASTNEAHYFKDRTGNRRFWPIAMGGMADIARLARDRDHLWAEAVVRYHQGERWWLTPALETLASHEQAQRMELDDWERRILDYADQHAAITSDRMYWYVTTAEVMTTGFQIENPMALTQANSKRIAGILRQHAWEHRQVRETPQGKQFWAFTHEIALRRGSTPTYHNAHSCHSCHSELPSNDASKEGCDSCDMCDTSRTQEGQTTPYTSMEVPVLGITAITATDSDRPPGGSGATTGSGLGLSEVLEAFSPPTEKIEGDVLGAVSRGGLSERQRTTLDTRAPNTSHTAPVGGENPAPAPAFAELRADELRCAMCRQAVAPRADVQADGSLVYRCPHCAGMLGSKTAPACAVSPTGQHQWLPSGTCLCCLAVRP